MTWSTLSSGAQNTTSLVIAALTGSLGFGLQGVFLAVAGGMLVYGVVTAGALRLGAWGRDGAGARG